MPVTGPALTVYVRPIYVHAHGKRGGERIAESRHSEPHFFDQGVRVGENFAIASRRGFDADCSVLIRTLKPA